MLTQQAYRSELKPNNKQRTLLAKHAGTARFAYNWGLARRIKEYKETQRSSNAIEQHRQLNTSVTVSREADRWFGAFCVERERGEYNRTVQDPAIGVDVGINAFKDFLHKLSTQLAKTRSVVVVEDLNVRGMMQNHHLSRHIADSGWGQFFTMLNYKTKWYGSRLIKAPRFYPSSKTCCVCGSIKPELSLKERQFVCDICGFTIDRDENAARNLEYLSTLLDSKHLTGTTGSSPVSYACGDTSGGGTHQRTLAGSTSHVSLKQETDTKYSPGIFG